MTYQVYDGQGNHLGKVDLTDPLPLQFTKYGLISEIFPKRIIVDPNAKPPEKNDTDKKS